MKAKIALVDCDNFFVSCERVFQPHLKKRPVVVLSSNDGCVIARSKEVKALNIKMGTPLHLCKNILNRHKVKIFSSNTRLYQDFSRRIMHLLKNFTAKMEVNSIDEAFLDLTHLASQNIENELCKIQKFIYQNLGLPISIGLAPNKTLAKIAGLFAKKSQGIFNYLALESKQKQQLLERVLVADIWGVGKQNQKKLNSLGIYTALELQKFDSSIIQKNLGITGSRLQYELRGLACLEIKPNPKPKKQIISSASFAQKIEKLTLLEQALASHIEIASQKLRAQNSVAGSISIFIQTSPWNRSPYYFKSEQAVFSTAHDSAAHFIKVAKAMLKTIYQENLAYQKTGVSLNQIIPKQAQSSLFQTECNSQSSHLIDQINKQHGAKTLRYGACGLNTSTWQPQKTHASPNYNSSWQELLLVKN